MDFNLNAILPPTIPLTILLEGIVLWLWSQTTQRKRRAFPRRLGYLTIANFFTQIILITTLLWPSYPYWTSLLTLEILIVMVEAWVLTRTNLPFRQALKLSLLVNLVSFGVGLIVPI